MIGHTAAQAALRARVRTVQVVTTGATSLAATGSTYVRTSGSFVTDGFEIGMELTPDGFTDTAVSVVTAVAALTLTVNRALGTEVAAGGRTLSVGMPSTEALENTGAEPEIDAPYWDEDYVPAGPRLLSAPANGGTVEDAGAYVVKLYGVTGTGYAATRKLADALLLKFAPGTTIAVGSDTLRVRTDTGPSAGQIIQLKGGRHLCTVTIPWHAFTTNAIAA